MKVENKRISLKTSDWKFKIKPGKRRMKIYIKLSKEEGNRWLQIKDAVIGDKAKIEDGEFAKIILFRGLNAFMDDLHTAMDEMDDEEKEKLLRDAGVDPEMEINVPVMEMEIPVSGSSTDITNENNDDAEEFTGSEPELSTEE